MKIIWTDFAIENLKDIFDYYFDKATNKVIHKVRNQILDAIRQLINHLESQPLIAEAVVVLKI